MAAECLAMLDAVGECLLINTIVKELYNTTETPLKTTCYVDSRSLVELIKSTKDPTDKRLLISTAALRESILDNKMNVEWVRTQDNIADILTKNGVNSEPILSNLF